MSPDASAPRRALPRVLIAASHGPRARHAYGEAQLQSESESESDSGAAAGPGARGQR